MKHRIIHRPRHFLAHRPGTAAWTMILVTAAICFGLVPLFAKSLQQGGTSSAAVAFYRFGLPTMLLLPFLPISREKRGEALLLGSIGALMGLSWIGYLESIKVASVAIAGIIYMSYPLFTLLFAWLLLGHRPTRRGLFAVFLIGIAALLTFSPGNIPPAALPSLLWALPAPVSFGLIIVLLSGCRHSLTVIERMLCVSLGASLGLLPLVLQSGPGHLLYDVQHHWVLIIGITLITAFIPQFLYIFASPRVGPARSAATGSFELPTMILVGWLLFGEFLGWREILAAACVIGAVLASPVGFSGTKSADYPDS
jgi:drug/metabolite transporter (DMT)-like permease